MVEFGLPKIDNEFNIIPEEWDETQKYLETTKFKLQEINDKLESGLTSCNFISFRNTYIINTQDSLDETCSMYVHFNILDEMIKIVSVKVDLWILNYRVYSEEDGISEEKTSPIIKFYVSENAGDSYSDVFGGYNADKLGIDITSWLTKAGSKLIKFTSTKRARLIVQIEIKLDIRARG